jgi:TolA-binding protein
MGIANCLFALGEYEEAADRYAALPVAQPRHFAWPPAPPFLHSVPPPLLPWSMSPPTPDRRAEYMVAECAFRSGDLERAADMFEGLATDAPGSAEANDALHRLALIRGDMTVDPDGAELYLAGLKARERGAHERARDDLDELVGNRPRGPLADDAIMLLADILAEEGKIEEARSAYDRLMASQPNSPLRPEAMLAAGGLCEERLDDADDAALYYDRVLREYPRSPVAAQARIRLDDMKQRQ